MASSQSESKLFLPGFGRPINCYTRAEEEDRSERGDSEPEEDDYALAFPPLPSALNPADLFSGRVTLPLTTLREFKMLQIMDKITDKPDWHVKAFDDAIVDKWEEEALAAQGQDVSKRMMDWVIAELRYKASIFEKTGAVSVYTGDVVKSDSALDESFKLALRAAVAPLENVPEKQQDWHPDSDEKVLDLVHPSLFPLIYGQTRILESGRVPLNNAVAFCGKGVVAPIPSEEETDVQSDEYRNGKKKPYSRKFQWLPCEVDISGGVPRITSYINNLHPEKHEALYKLIAKAIGGAIPLWEMTLGPLVDCDWGSRVRIHYLTSYYSREIVQPNPDTFCPPSEDPEKFDIHARLKDKGLQVIVKLANILLTPEKPNYDGGSWHVEGQLNEHICATALYYYSNENITPSTLAFRQQSDHVVEMDYEQDFHDWLPVVYGCENNTPGVQVVGGVHTREGRLLTFPNILQHQVQPFSLADPTKPGHRKILALFLVDPDTRVISTANVPPQQMDWWKEEVSRSRTGLDKLPNELKSEVFKNVEGGFPITLDEAKELRLEVMKERKHFEIQASSAFAASEFSLCEH